MNKEKLSTQNYIDRYAWKSLHKSNLEEIVHICDFTIDNYEKKTMQIVISIPLSMYSYLRY